MTSSTEKTFNTLMTLILLMGIIILLSQALASPV